MTETAVLRVVVATGQVVELQALVAGGHMLPSLHALFSKRDLAKLRVDMNFHTSCEVSNEPPWIKIRGVENDLGEIDIGRALEEESIQTVLEATDADEAYISEAKMRSYLERTPETTETKRYSCEQVNGNPALPERVRRAYLKVVHEFSDVFEGTNCEPPVLKKLIRMKSC